MNIIFYGNRTFCGHTLLRVRPNLTENQITNLSRQFPKFQFTPSSQGRTLVEGMFENTSDNYERWDTAFNLAMKYSKLERLQQDINSLEDLAPKSAHQKVSDENLAEASAYLAQQQAEKDFDEDLANNLIGVHPYDCL